MKLKTILLSFLLVTSQSIQAETLYGSGYFERTGNTDNRENTMAIQSFDKNAVAFEGTQSHLPISALVNHKDGCEMPEVNLN